MTVSWCVDKPLDADTDWLLCWDLYRDRSTFVLFPRSCCL